MSPVRSIDCVAPDPDRVFGEERPFMQIASDGRADTRRGLALAGLILGYGQIAVSTTLIALLIASATG